MTEAEIAQALDVTERTVRRDWQKGQLLLRAVLAEEQQGGGTSMEMEMSH